MQSWLIRKAPGMFRRLFKTMINSWAKDEKAFIKFSDSQLTEVERKHPSTSWMRTQSAAAVKSALHSTNPLTAPELMCAELMASTYAWPMDIGAVQGPLRRGPFPVHVWHGTLDEVTPNGAFLHKLWGGLERAEAEARAKSAAAAPSPAIAESKEAAAPSSSSAVSSASDAPVERVHLHIAQGFAHSLIFYKFQDILAAGLERKLE
jgi:hypothetical protein